MNTQFHVEYQNKDDPIYEYRVHRFDGQSEEMAWKIYHDICSRDTTRVVYLIRQTRQLMDMHMGDGIHQITRERIQRRLNEGKI